MTSTVVVPSNFPLSTVIILSFILLVAPIKNVVAEQDPPYTLGRIGVMSVGEKNANEQQMLGVVIGYRLNFSFYVEGELNVPVSGGEYVTGSEQGRMRITTLGVYGVYRYVFSPAYYAKLKAGVAYEDISRSDNNTENATNSSGGSGGAGVGFGIVYHVKKKPVMIELEATSIEQNVVLYTVGMTYPF